MVSKKGSIACFLVGVLMACSGSTEAGMLVLEPTQVAVAPVQGAEPVKTFVQFDLSGVPEGEEVVLAMLDWPLDAIPSDAWTEYAAFAVEGSWTEAQVGSGQLPEVAEVEAAWWDFAPLDYQRNGGGLVRFRLEALASGWAGGSVANHGIVIVTGAVSRASMVSEVSSITLTVHHR